MSDTILELKNITKKFPGVVALNGVSIDVRPGEIHALCGENGAGKSTLIKTCTGAVVPDEGEIVINGESYSSMTPQLADKTGIAVIYQELNSVGDLCAAENVFLGNEIRRGIVVDRKEMARRAAEVFESLNIKIDPYELVRNLSVGYRQMIEIAKAIVHDAKVLIMDEPSAPLTNNETETLFSLVEDLRKKGVGIVYISHRMPEIFRLSDRITVMRDGQKIKTLNTSDTNNDELIKLMVGRELTSTFPVRAQQVKNEILLDVQGVTGNGVKNVSFQLKKGEILGFAGLVGAGRTELMELLCGVKKIESGKIIWKGEEVRFDCPKKAIRAGIVLCPEDRKQQGVCLPLSIWDNTIMASLEDVSNGIVVNNKKAEEVCTHYKEKLKIKTPSLEQAVKNLSGGNQQKVVLAKGLATAPELVIFDEPTRGIDVGAKAEIYKLLNDLIEEGKTIIMISSEMEELMGMADRIIVLAEGRCHGELMKGEFSQERIMQYASGLD